MNGTRAKLTALATAIGLALVGTAAAESPEQWYQDGAEAVKEARNCTRPTRAALSFHEKPQIVLIERKQLSAQPG